MSLYVLHSIQLAGASAVRIGSITQISLPRNVELSAEATAGSPFARFTSVRSLRPTVSFTTRNIELALALTGSTSLAIKTGGTYTAFEVFYAKLDDCGRIASGSVHTKLSYDLGCLVPRVLSASAGQDAELTMEFLALSSDGVTSPLTITGSQALPALPDDERFALGPAEFEDSVVLDRLQQLSVDFGNTINAQQLDTGLYPYLISVDSQIPTITFNGMGIDDFGGSVAVQGLKIEHAESLFWFRKRRSGATALFADTAEEHLKLTADGLVMIDDPLSASNNAPAAISGTVTCQYDGTNAPIVIAADQAIEVV
jgi:hypothetical protein